MILLRNIETTQLGGNELKKYRRKKRILRLLYNRESVSGPEICKNIGVSLPTALVMLNELIARNFVEIRGFGQSIGGRKPTMFGLCNNSICVIACELGRYKGKITIYNSHNEAIAPTRFFDTHIDDNNLVEKIFQNAQDVISENKIDDKCIFGVGLTMPGLIDENRGINHTIINPDFRNIEELLAHKFNKLIYINNDARMQAYGEYRFGTAKGYENALIVNWNWGLGMGMILDGKLYNGTSGFAGELSHIKYREGGELCICGKRGCLETVASVNAILKNAKRGIENGQVSQLTKEFKNRKEEVTADDVITAAKSGDEFSISLLHEVGMALGEGLSVTIQLLNPDIIVVGGIMAKANQFVLTAIQQSLNKHCLEQISANTKIEISACWEQSGLLGVTSVLFQKLFSDMNK